MNVGSRDRNISPGQYHIGFTISEYSPWRQYFQWELYLQPGRQFENVGARRLGGDTVINNTPYKVEYRESYEKVTIFSAELVPLHFRYNISAFASVGAGALVATEISKTSNRFMRTKMSQPNGTNTDILEGALGKKVEDWGSFRGALFGDLQLGRVRVGPALGIRFLQYFNPGHQRLVLYLGWKL
jgi:hypothetical protein